MTYQKHKPELNCKEDKSTATSGTLMVSVIIPAYRKPEMLSKAILSVLEQDMDPSHYEVIVVDSSPDDQNVKLVAKLQSEACCSLKCFTKKAEGPGPSRNLGAHHAQGKFLAFMDSDCQASPQWLRTGIAAFEEGVGLVQGKTIPESEVPQNILNHYIRVEQETFLYETANMFYRRNAFEQVGGFAPDLQPNALSPMGGEDTELAWKVKRNGWKSTFADNALVMHAVVRISLWQLFVFKRIYIFPRLLHDFPELRYFFFARYFYNKTHAWLILGLLGLALSPLTYFTFLLVLPYVIGRASEPTRMLKGPLRLLRVLIYLVRDVIALCLLLAGSIRFGALLL